MSADILERIVASKRERLARGAPSVPTTSQVAASSGERFLASLREPGVRVIAEIKERSPSAGQIVPGMNGKVESFALAYRRGHAAAISVVTEEDHFGGRPEWIPRVRRISGLPVLMKDFIVSESQLDLAASLGADAVLLIARILSDDELASFLAGARRRAMAAVIEAHDENEIARACALRPDVIGVNARDLASFQTDLARLEGLASRIDPGPVKLAESAIREPRDIARLRSAGWEAFLVGEALLRSDDPEETLRALKQ